MIALCATAMGVENDFPWNPLERDEQAMAMVKRFRLAIEGHEEQMGPAMWGVHELLSGVNINSPDLNRAICECVANLQKAKINKAA